MKCERQAERPVRHDERARWKPLCESRGYPL
nr:MAG TPA: hypothetical protein [Caudoviricetes sp.]